MDDSERYRLYSVAFEPFGDGFVYYRNRWSRGVPVSADERERFLSSNPFSAYRLGREWARQRTPVAPPRRGASGKIMDAMPTSSVLAFVTATAIFAGAALKGGSYPYRGFMLLMAVFFAAFTVTLLWRRVFR